MKAKTVAIIAWWLAAMAIVVLPMLVAFAREEFFYVEPTGPRDGSRHPEPHDLGTPSPTSRGLRLEIDGSAVSSAVMPYETTTYVSGWCGPCYSMQANNGSGDTRVSCRYVDAESEPVPRDVAKIMQELKRKDQANIPLTTWIDGKGCLRWWVGPLSLDQLVAKIELPSNDPPTDQGDFNVATSPNTSAGVIHGKEVIQNLLGKWRHHIGSGTVTFSWSRNGSQTLPMLRLKEWTARSIYGSNGSFNLNVTGANEALPVTAGVIDYRIDSLGKLRLRGETEIDASILGITSDKPQAVGSAQPVGISPMLILSGLSMLWQLLNPQMDVILPGEIAATATMVGDSLVFTFKDAPSVKIVMLFSFNLRVESVAISESKVVAKFSGSRFITQKTFELK